MWIKRLTTLLALFCLASGAAASSQTVFANGGGALYGASGSAGSELNSRPAAQLGVRLWYTDLLRMRGAVTFQGLSAVELGMEVHPFDGRGEAGEGLGLPLDPYAFAGFGRYFAGEEDEQAVVPLGLGVTYPLGQRLNLNVEVAGRFTLAQPPGEGVDVISGVAPSVGISYDFGWLEDRPEPGQPALFAARSAAESAAPPAGEAAPAPSEDVSAEAVPDEETPSEEAPAEEIPAEAIEMRRPEDAVAREAPMPDGDAQRSGGVARMAPQPSDAAPSDTTDDQRRQNQMRQVPAGTFVMGLTDEDPLDLQQAGRKRVSVTPFRIHRYEVSNADYRAFLSDLTPSQRSEMAPDSTVWEQANSRSTWRGYFRGDEYADNPVMGVTHEQAQAYCAFYDKRLPTEAEWEYAARGNLVGSVYPWQGYEPRNSNGRYLANYNPDRGGYSADGYAFTSPGGTYPPSSWGLADMSGNVAEWVQDKYHPSYSDLSDFNPLYEDPDEERYVVRGGSWASNAFYIGVGVRDSQPGNEASPYIGFRCVDDIESY